MTRPPGRQAYVTSCPREGRTKASAACHHHTQTCLKADSSSAVTGVVYVTIGESSEGGVETSTLAWVLDRGLSAWDPCKRQYGG